MPKAGFDNTTLPESLFKTLRSIAAGSNVNIRDPKVIVNIITKAHLNVLNCNGVSLLAEAIHHQGEAHPIVAALKDFVTDEEFSAAIVASARMVDVAIEVAPAEIQESEPEAAPVVKRAIHDAVRENADDLDAIIKAGANVNEKDSDDRTPIQNAALNGFKKALETLLNHKADVTGLDVAALIGGNDEVIQYLIDRGVFTAEDLTYKAAGDDQYKAALGKLLVQLPNGMEIYLCDSGLNPLHVATKEQAVANIRTAIDSGISVESKAKDGLTALQKAVMEGKPKSFDVLIEKDADVFVEESTTGGNILHIAARVGDDGMAGKILELEAAPGLVKGKDSTGANPLHTAAALGRDNIITTIMDHIPAGVSKDELINAKDNQGMSVLSMAGVNQAMHDLLVGHGAKEEPAVEVEPEVPGTPEMARKAEELPESPKTPVQAQKVKSVPPTPATAMKVPFTAVKEAELSPLTNLIQAVCENDGNRVADILAKSNDPRSLLAAPLAMRNTSDVERSEDQAQSVNILEVAHALSRGHALQAMTKSWLDESILDLVEAMQSNNLATVKELLDGDKSKVLCETKFAITKADTSTFSGQLIASSGNGSSVWVSFKDAQNTSNLLHIAAVLGCNAEIIKALVNHEIGIDTQDLYGYTAMHYAVESKNKAVVKALKFHGTDLKIKSSGDKEDPSEMAAYLGLKDILLELLGQDMPTYIHLQKAIKSGSDETFKSIVSKSNQFLGFMNVREQQNILHHIAKDGTEEMVKFVNQRNHDVFNRLVAAKDAHKNIPLHLAGARELNGYKAFKALLSKHEMPPVKKGGFLGIGGKVVIDIEDISVLNNDRFQTPDQVHLQHHPDDAALLG